MSDILEHYSLVHENICEICVDRHGVDAETVKGSPNTYSGTFSKPLHLHEHITGFFHKADVTGGCRVEHGNDNFDFYCEICLQEYAMKSHVERLTVGKSEDDFETTEKLVKFKGTSELRIHYKEKHKLLCGLCSTDVGSRRYGQGHVKFRDAGILQRHLNSSAHPTLLEDGQFKRNLLPGVREILMAGGELARVLAICNPGYTPYRTTGVQRLAEKTVRKRKRDEHVALNFSRRSSSSPVEKRPGETATLPQSPSSSGGASVQEIAQFYGFDSSTHFNAGDLQVDEAVLNHAALVREPQCPICGECFGLKTLLDAHVMHVHTDFWSEFAAMA